MKSEIEVASRKLGYGCGGIWGMEYFPDARAELAFEAAVEVGIRFFDTGPSYSKGNAEKRLGRYLKNHEAGASGCISVGTKVGTHYSADAGRMYKDYSESAIIKSFEGSRAKLDRDCVDVLQLHGMPPPDIREAAIDTLCELKVKNLVRSIGVSCDGADLEFAVNDSRFDVVMATYNVIHRSNSTSLNKANASGKTVILKSPMAHRLYSADFYRMRSRQDVWYLARALKNKRRYMMLGRKYRFLSDELALQFACDPEFVNLAVIGSTRPENIRRNVEYLQGSLPEHIAERVLALRSL